MNTTAFHNLLTHPSNISAEDDHGLAEIIRTYPYFQSARALQLKGLKQTESFHYNKALKITAVYTTDRDVLFDFITSEYFSQSSIADLHASQQESIKAIEVVHQTIVQEESHEQDTPTDSAPKIYLSDPQSPLEFEKEERRTFDQWLQLTTVKPIRREQKNQETTDDQPRSNDHPLTLKIDRINKFIARQPQIDLKEGQSNTGDLSEPFVTSPDEIMTETLARVYLSQNNHIKAIEAYKILILKYPEKSGFFADQIRGIEQLINASQ